MFSQSRVQDPGSLVCYSYSYILNLIILSCFTESFSSLFGWAHVCLRGNPQRCEHVWVNSSVSHFLAQVRSSRALRCFHCVCVRVCVCSYLKVSISHTASFQPRFSFISHQSSSACWSISAPLIQTRFSCRLQISYRIAADDPVVTFDFRLGLGSIEHAVCLSPLFVSDNTKCLFVLLLCDDWKALRRPTVLFWWKLKYLESRAPCRLSAELNPHCLDCFDWT